MLRHVLTQFIPCPSRGCNVGFGDIDASRTDALGRRFGCRNRTNVVLARNIEFSFPVFPLTLFIDIDADRPKVGAVEETVVGAGEAHDGRRVDVVPEHQPLGTLVRHVGPRGNGGRGPWHSKSN